MSKQESVISNKGFRETLHVPTDNKIHMNSNIESQCMKIHENIYTIAEQTNAVLLKLEKKIDDQQEMIHHMTYLLKLATSPEDELDSIRNNEKKRLSEKKMTNVDTLIVNVESVSDTIDITLDD